MKMLRCLIAGLALLALSIPAVAQTQVITNCGTLSSNWVAGQTGRPISQDINGNQCFVGTPSTIFTGTFVPAAAYATQQNMGGLITIATGMGANTTVQIRQIKAIITGTTIVAGANINFVFFNALPTTTFTDASNTTLNEADATKFAINISSIAVNTIMIGAHVHSSNIGIAQIPSMKTDASGNIYLAIQSQGTFTITTPTHFNWAVDVGR